jgi:hypothetical protein
MWVFVICEGEDTSKLLFSKAAAILRDINNRTLKQLRSAAHNTFSVALVAACWCMPFVGTVFGIVWML